MPGFVTLIAKPLKVRFLNNALRLSGLLGLEFVALSGNKSTEGTGSMSAHRFVRSTLRVVLFWILEKVLRGAPQSSSEIDGTSIRRILVVPQFKSLASVLASEPVYRALAHHFQNASVTVVIASNFATLFEAVPNRQKLLTIDYPLMWSRTGLKRLFTVLRHLLAGSDMLVSLNPAKHILKQACIIGLCRPRYVIGPGGATNSSKLESLFNITTPPPNTDTSIVEQYCEIVKHIGIRIPDTELRQIITAGQFAAAIDLLAKNGVEPQDFIIGIQLGVGYNKNMWPPDHYVQVANHLSANSGARVVVFRQQRNDHSEQFIAGLPFKPVDILNVPVELEAALLRLCDVAICSHIDFMCLAASLQTPFLWLVCDQKLVHVKPVGDRFIVHEDLTGDYDSMQAEAVIRRIEQLLLRFPKSRRSSVSFDISDQAVNDFLGFGDIKENYEL